MKKCLVALLLLLLLPMAAFAESRAVVANPHVADRLILRSEPSDKGNILGRFYTGTPITVLEKNNDFCKVQLGSLQGYMKTVYLAFPLRNYDFETCYFTALPNRPDAPIYNKASTAGQVIGRANEKVYILGDINDDWRYVLSGENYGYMRAIHLNDTELLVRCAYLSTRVELYSDKKLTKKTGAVYQANTQVRVVDASRNGNWAKVEITGTYMEPGMEQNPVSGYMSQSHLNLFLFPWETMDYTLRAGILQEDLAVFSKWSGNTSYLKKGTMAAICGETEEEYHLIWDTATALVPKEKVTLLQHQQANRSGIVKPMGFALLQPGDEKRWMHNAQNQLIQQKGDQLQILTYNDMEWMDAENVLILKNADLYHRILPTIPAGDFAITDKNSAIWYFQVEKGQTANLSMKNETWNIAVENKTFTEGIYAYHLPEGTTGLLEGAEWNTGFSSLFSSLTPSYLLRELQEETPFFQGSGRLYGDIHLSDQSAWYTYRAMPLPGCEEASFTLTPLNTLNPEITPCTVDLFNLTYEDENIFRLTPGTFVELVNCELYFDFGNG